MDGDKEVGQVWKLKGKTGFIVTKAVPVLALLLLAGCSIRPYVDPIGSDTATLTFHNADTAAILVYGFKVGEDCSGGEVLFNSDARLYPNMDRDIRVAAGQEFSFYFRKMKPTSYGFLDCRMPTTLVPKPGGRYIARFSASDAMCYVGVSQVTPEGEKPEPTFRLRRWRAPLTGTGSFCR